MGKNSYAIGLTPNTRQGRGEEAPLQNPRPPETSPTLVKKHNSTQLMVNSHNLTQPLVTSSQNGGGGGTLASNRCHEQKLMYRAKRWSANLSRWVGSINLALDLQRESTLLSRK